MSSGEKISKQEEANTSANPWASAFEDETLKLDCKKDSRAREDVEEASEFIQAKLGDKDNVRQDQAAIEYIFHDRSRGKSDETILQGFDEESFLPGGWGARVANLINENFHDADYLAALLQADREHYLGHSNLDERHMHRELVRDIVKHNPDLTQTPHLRQELDLIDDVDTPERIDEDIFILNSGTDWFYPYSIRDDFGVYDSILSSDNPKSKDLKFLLAKADQNPGYLAKTTRSSASWHHQISDG